MLALLLDGSTAPRMVRDRPRPERPRGEARVRVRRVGVCDTDLQLARGYMGFAGVPGHEFVGDVIECDDLHWRGRRVVADINAGCGGCDECKARGGHHCERRSVLGILARDGAMAEELLVPERCLVTVPDAVPDDAAVFAEPLAAALHVLDEIDDRNQRVVVLGDGKLGLLVALALRSANVPTTVVGHHPNKLALAAAAGAQTVLESEVGDDLHGVATVVEATGSASGLARALSLLRPRGTLILKTTVAEPLTVDTSAIVVQELRVVGSRCGDLASAIATLEAGHIDPQPLIVGRLPLARADDALTLAARKGMLKVLIEAP
jgi:2-desacetyl-2-hydroxyethyl bacteriochlorophyllide A dehydrogenase